MTALTTATSTTTTTRRPVSADRTARRQFQVLANEWAERRLVTQWRHGCRAMRRSVCNADAFNGGRPLCVRISANILIPLERRFIAPQLCHWQFLYNETLQQTFRPLLLKLSKRRQIEVIYPHFEEVRGGVEPWLMTRWKARIRRPIRHNWAFFR